MRRALRDPRFIVGAAIAALLCSPALFGRALCPNDPLEVNFQNVLLPPGGDFPLGADDLGRCVFSRLLAGAGATLGSAMAVEAFILVLGLTIGVVTGYFGGALDAVGLVLTDAMLAFPSVILALVVAGFMGSGLRNLLIAMCCVHWVGHARVARSLARRTREKTFVLASRAAGSGHFKIITRRVLPHILPQMLVYSFIGLGVRPPQAEWGATLSEARAYMNTSPLALAAAVVCILLAVTSFQLIGESLRDALEVRASHLGLAKAERRGDDAGRA